MSVMHFCSAVFRSRAGSVAGLACALVLGQACGQEDDDSLDVPTWIGVCIDDDGDGYGLSCKAGADCDDQNAQLHVGCGLCDKPSEGCDCDPSHEPIDCTVPPELTTAGSLLCREGTRYCRDAHWTACEGITS